MGGVGRSSRRDGTGREVFPEGWEGQARSGGPPGGPGGVEDLSEGQQESGGFPEDRKGSVGLGGVRRPSRRARRGQEALLESREGSERTPGRPGGVRRPSWGTGGSGVPNEGREGWEGYPGGRLWLGGLPGGPGGVGSLSWRMVGVGRPSWTAGRGQKALLECQEGSGVTPRGQGGIRKGGVGRGQKALP